MQIETSRFGSVRVRDERVLTFPQGLLGFAAKKRFALIQPPDSGSFFWLQSTETADLAFVVTDPRLFVPDYRPPVTPDQLRVLGLTDGETAQLLVIVNKTEDRLTGNLRGPLVIHTRKMLGLQVVLADSRFHTRFPLVDLASAVREGELAGSV